MSESFRPFVDLILSSQFSFWLAVFPPIFGLWLLKRVVYD